VRELPEMLPPAVARLEAKEDSMKALGLAWISTAPY